MTTLKKGDKAPNFEGINQDEKTISLSDFNGKKLILWSFSVLNLKGSIKFEQIQQKTR